MRLTPFASSSVGRRVLMGLGQIYLQGSALSGALFLAALALGAWHWAVAAALGSLLGTLVGGALGADEKDLDDGLYGFNAALVLLAGAVFLTFDVRAVLLTTLAAAASTGLFHVAKRRHWSVFTAPFVLVTLPLLALPGVAPAFTPLHHSSEVVLRHAGQVVFLAGTWSGLLCLLGVFAGHRAAGAAALLASLLVFVAGVALPVAPQAFELGLYGFNAVLTAIALHQQRPRWWQTLAGAAVAALLSAAALQLELRVLTAPFVIVAWLGTRRR